MSATTPTSKDASETKSEVAENNLTTFFSSVVAKRELRRELRRSTNPADTIQAFQQEHSLHTMMARAFGTTPRHEMKKTRSQDKQTEEPLDSDPAIAFLSHLGVSHYEVHKRISDTLMKQLEEEIRKSKNTEALLSLLQSCLTFATTQTEMRPVLWAVLKQLGEDTPLPVLQALTLRDQDSKLRHKDLFEPLSPLLKRLCWEADWESRVSSSNADSRPLDEYQTTLLYETLEPLISQYCNNKVLVDMADQLFVSTVRERRVLTKQRRALTVPASTMAGSCVAKEGIEVLDSGKAIAAIRSLLCDTVGTASTFRPKLLYSLFSILMAEHGSITMGQIGGASNLRCTLVADILLSAGGPLPRGYQHLSALARTLDDCVQEGNISDAAVKKIQQTLTLIFLSDDDTTSSKAAESNAQSDGLSQVQIQEEISLAALRQLNKVITAGIDAMKDADPQSLFLNPVTDAIAPGYSKIISKPISLTQMEAKVKKNKYSSIEEWDKDVRLLFKNCVDYNRGPAGQWFRGEALRQGKVFRDEILPQAKRLYQSETAKRNFTDDSERKRKTSTEEIDISPLPAATRKRKKSSKDDQDPSMPALASMLLADPFVVRIVLARTQRDLRHGTLNGTSIPAAHVAAPSLLQLLHLARWSRQICAVSGRRYLIPDSGMQKLGNDNDPTNVPFATLRQISPLVLRLFLEAELDRRISPGGDLHAAAQSVSIEAEQINTEMWAAGDQMEVAAALLQGAIVFLCQPGLGNESSLALTFPKLALGVQLLLPTLCDHRAFFVCLSKTLLRHKAKLPKSTRDSVIQSWLGWLRADSRGSACTSAHEQLVRLLNDWSAFGNLILPRDTLVKVTLEAVRAVDSTVVKDGGDKQLFASLWNSPDASSFASVKEQYERMLTHLPATQARQWKDEVGLLPVLTEEASTSYAEATENSIMEE
ncbi:hypothetical protein MPSEU_000086200 [Mayamaea pseudoterrestris]|nr:hypothetical protein MPSEU_000086200 [Mayamaea pseudoterrestris]